MSGPYRPSDDIIGVVFLGAMIGLIGGAILGESPAFFVIGILVFFGVINAIIKGSGPDDDDFKRQDKT